MPQESATPINNTDLFNQALAQLQQKNWDGAIENYRKLLDQSQDSLTSAQASVIYHNMSMAAAEKADVLMAYAWSKKAYGLNPGNSAAREAFENYSKQFQAPSIPHQISNFDNFKSVIGKIPLDVYLVLAVIMVVISLWQAGQKMILTRKNQMSEVFNYSSRWPVYILSTLSLLFITTAYFRYLDWQIPLGILISDKVQVQTAAGADKPVIFEAPAGLEVEVLSEAGDFFQVRSAGAFSGWVKKNQVEVLSLNFGHAH